MNTFAHKLFGWIRVNRLRLAWGFVVVLGLLLLGAGLSAYLSRPQHGRPALVERAAPTLMATGHVAIGQARFWGLSASGRFLCTMDNSGLLRLCETRSREVFRVAVPGCDTATVAPSGRWVIAYARMNTEAPRVTFIGANGKTVTSVSVNGAVWCSDAASAEDEDVFAVGTGNGTLFVFRNNGNGWRRKSYRAEGAIVSVGIDPGCNNVVIGCWQRSLIEKIDMDHRQLWQAAGDSQSLQDVSLLWGGQRLFLQSRPNNPLKVGHYGMLDSDGATLWTLPTCFTAAERFHPSPSGDFVAVAYSRPITNKDKVLYERHCEIVDPNGEVLVDKGSLFSDIRPIMMTDSGYAIVHNTNKSLMSLGVTSDLKPLAQVQSKIVDSRESKDGSTLAVRCEDGEVRSFRVVQ